MAPGGSRANLAWVTPHVRFDDAVDAPARLVLADAQTNGGLLAAIAAESFGGVMQALERAGVQAAAIGEVIAADGEARIDVEAS